MLYNKNLKRIKTSADCITCEHFDSTTKQCKKLECHSIWKWKICCGGKFQQQWRVSQRL